MAAKTGGLGKGLDALIRRTDDLPEQTKAPSTRNDKLIPGQVTVQDLPLSKIKPNPKQPRSVFDEDALQELVESIKEVGVLQPVIVRQVGQGFELIMGERRFRASKLAGKKTVPAIVRDTADNDLLRDALIENIHRSQLNPLEEAAAYQQMLEDFGCTQEELSLKVKRSRPQISNAIRLLKLPAPVQRRVAAGVLSAGHARALLSLDDQLQMEQLAQRIVAEGMSVRATEEAVTMLLREAPAAPKVRKPKQPSPRAQELSQDLSDHFDTRVTVNIGKNKGQMVIEFAGEEDLERILNIIEGRH